MIARSLAAVCLLFAVAVSPVLPRRETGIASVYAYRGGKTASGERANPSRFDRRTSHVAVRHHGQSHQQEQRQAR